MTHPLYKTPDGAAAFARWYDDALARLGLPHESRMLATPFGATHALTFGPPEAPPIVMVQGFGAAAPLWKNQLPALAPHYRLYALDVPGHPGRSEPRVLSLLDDSYGRWLAAALDALNLPRAHIMGVCLGGWAAMQLAHTFPARVDKLVLLSPVGLARFKVYVRSGVPLILNFGRDPERAGEKLLRDAFTPQGSGLIFDRDVARALMLVIKHYDIAALAGFDGAQPRPRDIAQAARVMMKFVRAEPPAGLRRISAPTLLLVGEYEAIYNPQAALRRARAIPNLSAEIVPATGHAAIYDRPDYVNPRLLDFLAR
jgi:pimeloyl-ACP methyl ester carboxylesterase